LLTFEYCLYPKFIDKYIQLYLVIYIKTWKCLKKAKIRSFLWMCVKFNQKSSKIDISDIYLGNSFRFFYALVFFIKFTGLL